MLTGKFITSAIYASALFLTITAKGQDIVPAPKEMKIHGEEALFHNTGIVIDGSRKSELGAAEINRALKLAGSKELKVSKLEKNLSENLILLGAIGKSSLLDKYIKKFDLKVTKENPGEQGYVIYFPKSGKVKAIIVGSDEQGSLYGAVTFAQLISCKDGKVAIKKADVRDWPDFKRRQIGNLGMSYQRQHWYSRKNDPKWKEKHFKLQRDYIDWCLRRKINVVRAFVMGKGVGQARFPDWDKEDLAWMKVLCEYARERGIQTVVDHARVVYLGDSISFTKKHPEIKRSIDPSLFKDWDCGIDHDLHFCWSRDEMHQKQAEAYAKTVKEYFPGALVWFHLLDAPPSGSWVMRCGRCKKKFRNDRAKADAHVAMIYKKEFEKHAKAKNLAFCFWPYGPYYLKYPDIVKYFKDVNEMIPKDTVILTREFNRAGTEKMRNIYKGHPFYFYIEDAAINDSQHMGSRGLVPSTPTYFKTYLFDNPNDVIFLSTHGDKTGIALMDEALGAEFSWNTLAPGNQEMFSSWDFLKQHSVPKESISRICKNIWGSSAGEKMGIVFNSGINANFICNPEKVIKHENKTREKEGLEKIQKITTLSRLMKAQMDATGKAVKVMDKLLQANSAFKPGSEKYFSHYYANISFLNVCAQANYYYLLGKELAIAGKEKEAREAITKGFERIAAGEKYLPEVLKRIQGKPDCYPRRFRVSGETGVTMKSLKKRLEMISKNVKDLYKKYNIPKKIKDKILEPRTIKAVKVSTPPVIDGRINDDAWKKASNEKYFVCYDQLKLARAQTQVAVLYDDKNLYLRFICEDPQIMSIGGKKRPHDSWSEKDDMIEIFLTPDKRESTYCQLAASYAGTKFDSDYRDMTLGGISGRDSKSEWNPEWEIKTSKDDKAWYAEIKIPFSSLKTAPYSKFSTPKKGDSWNINLCRDWYDKKVGDIEYSSTCFTEGKGFHERSKYSKLIFK
jgi:cellulose/xylan binding protein with CBM9 domain/glycosyl hydrolase family 20